MAGAESVVMNIDLAGYEIDSGSTVANFLVSPHYSGYFQLLPNSVKSLFFPSIIVISFENLSIVFEQIALHPWWWS